MATKDVLAAIYIAEPCNVCGERYPVTLYEIHQEHVLEETWAPPRPCTDCARAKDRVVAGVPREELAALAHALDAGDRQAIAQAWQRLDAALRARGLEPTIEPEVAPLLQPVA
jgi:hypothetical protein